MTNDLLTISAAETERTPLDDLSNALAEVARIALLIQSDPASSQEAVELANATLLHTSAVRNKLRSW